MLLIISISFAVIYSVLILPFMMRFTFQSRIRRKNYKGVHIPCTSGLAFSVYIVLICGFLILYNSVTYRLQPFTIDILSVLSGILSASYTGFIDDIEGDESHKGIKGHVSALLKLEFTSGVIKASTGFIIAFIISFSWDLGLAESILNGFIICLMQNFINLLDLRPGRAVKTYGVLLFLSLLFAALKPVFSCVCISTFIVLLFYLHYELNEKCMMGDTGSNTLGILLGIAIASSSGYAYKIIILIFLILTHIFSEKRSINSLIEKVRVLKYIDMIGRRK